MSRLRSESGLTLVEMLVTTTIMVVVFGAVLGALDAFQRKASADTVRAEAQDSARNALDQMSRRLRSVVSSGTTAAIERSAANDVVFRVVDPANPPVSGGANAARLMFVRFCVDDATDKLYEQTFHWSTATTPSPPDSSPYPCPGAGWDTSNRLAADVTTPGGAIFSYSPSASAVSRIDVDLTIDRDPAAAPDPVSLHSAVRLRNLNAPPSVALNCAAVGSGQVVCDSFGTADPDGGAVTYTWSYGSGSTCTGLTTLSSTLPQINQAGLSAGTYCFKLSAADPSGMSSSATQVVTAA